MPANRLPIIGHPLGPSPIEAVLAAAFEAVGSEALIERWERRPHQLADAVAELRSPDVLGALIAPPHKEKAPALVNTLSEDAKQSGAVSVVVHADDRLRGHNADMDGIRAGLAAVLPKVQGKWPRQAVVLGAGGGARAAVAVLIGAGFQHVAVFNRHLHKAEALVAHFSRSARHMELRARPWHEAILEAEVAKSPLIINASGVGTADEPSPIPGELIPEGRTVLDLALQTSVTPLMREVRAREGTAANGRVAFLASAAATFRLLADREAPGDVLESALKAELGQPASAAVVGD